MIYLCVTGRLGNQMFQYAFAKQLSELTGQKITINLYYLKKFTNYKFQLDIFKLIESNNVTLISNKPMPFFSNIMFYPMKFFRKVFPNIYRKFFGLFGGIIDLSMQFHPVNTKHKNFYVLGYFQSELYFRNIRSNLLSDFSLRNNSVLNKKIFYFYEKIVKTNSVCISIRRGDYITNKKVSSRFFICDTDYYDRAVKLLSSMKNCQLTLFIFSDDPGWARDNVLLGTETFYEPLGLSIEEKIFLMKQCKDFIISNSSFSWWIQYLSENKFKKVVAPKQWLKTNEKTSIYELQDFLYV